MANNNHVISFMRYGIDVIISTSAVFGICLLWANFNGMAYETILRIATAPFTCPSDEKKKKDDSSSDSSDEEEGYRSDHCIEARPQVPELPSFYIS